MVLYFIKEEKQNKDSYTAETIIRVRNQISHSQRGYTGLNGSSYLEMCANVLLRVPI